MTLRIVGKRGYLNRVHSAIKKICPCFTYSLENGILRLQSPTDHDAFCKCYCSHRAGCNLISDLVNHANTVTIGPDKTSFYLPDDKTVHFNSKKSPKTGTAKGKQPTPPEIVLGHELIHAHHDNIGTLASGKTGGIKNEEINTVRGENQLRAEQTPPVDQRTTYSGKKVPNPGGGNLDTTPRFDCKCAEAKETDDTKGARPVSSAKITDALMGMTAGAHTLGDTIEEAIAARSAALDEVSLDQLMARLGTPKQTILLESIAPDEDTHIYVLMAQDGDQVTVITNGQLEESDGLWDLATLETPKTYAATATAERIKLMDLALETPLKGATGSATALGASVEILTVIEGDSTRSGLLVGGSWAPFSEFASAPKEGEDTWAAIGAVWEAMISVVSGD